MEVQHSPKWLAALSRLHNSDRIEDRENGIAVACLRHIPTRRVPTAASDGLVILYNPDYVDSLSIAAVVGLAIHEADHGLREHHQRLVDSGWFDRDTANIAMDCEINPAIEAAGYTLPDGGMYPSKFGFDSALPWEAYYSMLKDKARNDAAQDDPGDSEDSEDSQDGDESDENAEDAQGEAGDESLDSTKGKSDRSPDDDQDGSEDEANDGDGDETNGEAGSESAAGSVVAGPHAPGELAKQFAPELVEGMNDQQIEQLAKDTAELMRDIAPHNPCATPANAKPGTTAGGDVYRAKSETILCDPQTDWRELTLGVVADLVGGEAMIEWRKRDWRFSNFYYAGKRKVSAIRIALVLDTSGSCVRFFAAWQSMAQRMVDELDDIAEIDLIYHDTRVQAVEHWERADGPVIVTPRGGGGTDHCAALARAESLDPDLIVLFTDSESSWPSKPPRIECVTVLPPGSSSRTPFGKNIVLAKF